jgi:large subunit ribosomal protein L35
MKSHTGMGKRVRITGTGKVVSQQAGMRHHLELKSSTRTRRLAGKVVLTKADTKRIKRLLGR